MLKSGLVGQFQTSKTEPSKHWLSLHVFLGTSQWISMVSWDFFDCFFFFVETPELSRGTLLPCSSGSCLNTEWFKRRWSRLKVLHTFCTHHYYWCCSSVFFWLWLVAPRLSDLTRAFYFFLYFCICFSVFLALSRLGRLFLGKQDDFFSACQLQTVVGVVGVPCTTSCIWKGIDSSKLHLEGKKKKQSTKMKYIATGLFLLPFNIF